MKEKSLLERVRELNRLILNSEQNSLDIGAGLKSVSALLDAAALIIDTGGTRSGEAYPEGWPCGPLLEESEPESSFEPPSDHSDGEPRVNLPFHQQCCRPAGGEGCSHGELFLTALPLVVAEESAGTLLLVRCGEQFNQDDIILAEIGSTVLELMLVSVATERQLELERNKALAAIAFESLSFSEVEAIEEIFRQIEEQESIVVASKVADDLGITRSVIVNALRKFESAGIIESRSLGMKGTFIRIKNPQALAEIAGRSKKFKQDYA